MFIIIWYSIYIYGGRNSLRGKTFQILGNLNVEEKKNIFLQLKLLYMYMYVYSHTHTHTQQGSDNPLHCLVKWSCFIFLCSREMPVSQCQGIAVFAFVTLTHNGFNIALVYTCPKNPLLQWCFSLMASSLLPVCLSPSASTPLLFLILSFKCWYFPEFSSLHLFSSNFTCSLLWMIESRPMTSNTPQCQHGSNFHFWSFSAQLQNCLKDIPIWLLHRHCKVDIPKHSSCPAQDCSFQSLFHSYW